MSAVQVAPERRTRLMSEMKKSEMVSEEEFTEMLKDVQLHDDDEIDEADVEDERLFECQKKS